MTLRLESVTRLAIPGGWGQRDVKVGGHSFQLTLPRDPDEFVYASERQSGAGSAGGDVYWAQLWPAALVTAQLVVAAPWNAGATAIELGCGIGLLGLAAAASGLRATFSDYVPEAVELAVENARRNGFRDVHGIVLDWRHPDTHRYDVVLASDVLYYKSLHDDLLNTIDRVLAPDGVCWIGDAGRESSLPFVELARECFHVELCCERGQPIAMPRQGTYFLVALRREREPQ